MKYANHYFLLLCRFYAAVGIELYLTLLIGGLQDIYTAVKMAITVSYRTYQSEYVLSLEFKLN